MAAHDFEVYATVVTPARSGEDPRRRIAQCAQRAERYGLDGVVASYHRSILDPWAVAAIILDHTRRISPLVAVPPYALPPFAAARLLSSLSSLYRRRIDISVIADATPQELSEVGDQLSHDDRHERAAEYLTVVRTLLASGQPLTHDGRFYRYQDMRLDTRLDPGLRPRAFVDGSSAAGQRMADAVADVSVIRPEQAGQPARAVLRRDGVGPRVGIRTGLVARATDEEARAAARARYPGGATPLLAGSYHTVAGDLGRYLRLGVSTLILTGLQTMEDYEHADIALTRLRDQHAGFGKMSA